MKKPFHNHTKKPVYVGSTLIMPGQSRDVDVASLNKPETTRAAAKEPSLIEEIQSLAIGKAKERFGELETPQLIDLQSLEESQDEPRSGMLTAITEELLSRESAGLEDDDTDSSDD